MLITQGSEDRALLLAPSFNKPSADCLLNVFTFLLGFAKSYHLYMSVGSARKAFVLFMLVVKVVESTWVPRKRHIRTTKSSHLELMFMIVTPKSKSEDTPAG